MCNHLACFLSSRRPEVSHEAEILGVVFAVNALKMVQKFQYTMIWPVFRLLEDAKCINEAVIRMVVFLVSELKMVQKFQYATTWLVFRLVDDPKFSMELKFGWSFSW